MTEPTFRSLLTATLPAALVVSYAPAAHAYLVPLLGGAWVLLSLIFAGLAIVGSFIALHFLRLKNKMKARKAAKEAPADDTEAE